MNMSEIFEEEEKRLLAEGRAAIAADDAAWAALTQDQRDAISKSREERFAEIDTTDDGDDQNDDEEEEDLW